MIIWINGAFGSGKSQTAHELHRRLPQSFIYDPERAGYFIRRNVPAAAKQPDFQDYPMWRETNVAMLKYIDAHYDGTILVPMTVVVPQYYDEMIGRLREEGVDVRHFALCAEEEELRRRLRSRGEGRSSWAAQQIGRCVTALSEEKFGVHVDTNHLTISETAEWIARHANLALAPDHRSSLRKRWDRVMTQLKQIRLFGG